MRVKVLSRPFLDEGACVFDYLGSLMEQTPPGAGKTPTTPSRVADLAAVVDGGSGIQRITVHPARGDSYHLFILVLALPTAKGKS